MLSFRPTLYALGAILLWSTQALVLATELPHLNLLVFLTLSFLFSGITFLCRNAPELLKFAHLKGENSIWNGFKKAGQEINNLDFFKDLILFFFYHYLLFRALDLGPALVANLLNYLWPIFYMIWAEKVFPAEKVFQKDKYNEREKLFVYTKIIFGFLGCLLLVTRGGAKGWNFLGPICGLLAAIIWAWFSIRLKHYKGTKKSFVLRRWWTGYAFGAAFISVAILFITNTFSFPGFEVWKKAFWPAFYFGVGPLGIAMIWYDKAVKHSLAEKLSRLTFLTPLLSSILLVRFTEVETYYNPGIGVGILCIIAANLSLRETRNRVMEFLFHRNGVTQNYNTTMLNGSLPLGENKSLNGVPIILSNESIKKSSNNNVIGSPHPNNWRIHKKPYYKKKHTRKNQPNRSMRTQTAIALDRVSDNRKYV